MKENWVLIYSYYDLFKAKLAEDILKQNGIESHIANKPDSAIPAIGQAELYTLPENLERAREILKEEELG